MNIKQNNTTKNILITGGAKRLGKDLVKYFASNDYNIIFTYNNSENEAKELVEETSKKNPQIAIESHKLEVRNINEITRLMFELSKKHKNIDLLINNASIFEATPFLETSEEDFNAHQDINFKAPFFITQQYAKNFLEGHIINIIDTQITKNLSIYFTYILGKKSLYDFTMQAAKELAPNFRVNSISPGSIYPQADHGVKADDIISNLPMKNHATPLDICYAIEYLHNNKIITGQNIFLDGGKNLQ